MGSLKNVHLTHLNLSIDLLWRLYEVHREFQTGDWKTFSICQNRPMVTLQILN